MRMPFEAKDYLLIMTAYALGCFTSGYYLVRWVTGNDIRLSGSGSTGATNVSRVMGRSGFIAIFLLDCLKGSAAVGLGRIFELGTMSLILVMLAVVAGHMWPLQLRFRGGKGIATGAGALLVYNYFFVIVLIGLFLTLFLALRNFVLSGLAAFALAPLILYGFGFPLFTIMGVTALAVMILAAHRRNIPEEWSRFLAGKKLNLPDHEIRRE